MMVSGGTTKDCLSKSKAYLFELHTMREKANSVLCICICGR